MVQLQVRYPGREHLLAIRDAMPNLNRLEVRGWKGSDLTEDPVLFHQGQGAAAGRDTLEFLEVGAIAVNRLHYGRN